ncbi:MAG TPA: CHAT domain-containing protein [Thermoanaerobaculia bacterium]|nr:CHAT domain-containing protein [Thermoanaerobaculia bacterium]
MAEDGAVTRLRSLAGRLAERSAQLRTMRGLVDPLRTGGLEPVEGEIGLLAELEEKLQAAAVLLAKTEDAEPLDALNAQLDDLLNDVSWELEEDLRPDLTQKHQRQEDLLREVGLDLKTWEGGVTELAKKVETARFEGAPFSALEADLERARRLLASIRSAISDRLYRGLPELQESAKDAMRLLAENVTNAQPQVEKVKKLVKQADLLIMQVGLADGDYEYRVLLRSADRFQTRGINIIQDVRRVSQADRNYMKDLLAQLTSKMNQQIRSAHSAAHPEPPGQPRTILPAEGSSSAPARNATEALAVLGDFMYRLVIPGEMQRYLQREAWSFSITTNDLELPWELISFERPEEESSDPAYLCLERCISRMPLGGVFPPPPRRRSAVAPPKRRMLLIHSDPNGDLPAAAREADEIAKALSDKLEIERVDPDQATNANINDILMGKPFDFLHYAGHAYFDKKDPNLSGLQLKDSRLTAEKIRRLNKGGSLVFLNACESGTVARDSEAQQVSYLLSNPEPVVGLASAFVYSGALGCVGSLWPVYDRPAAELAVKFYEYVLLGEPTGEALRKARNDIRAAYPREVTWAGYVLYGDPTFRLTET